MEHQWKLYKKALTTSMWICPRCELKASLPSHIQEFDIEKVHQYHWPRHWSKLDIKEAKEQLFTEHEPRCMTSDDRLIRDIIL